MNPQNASSAPPEHARWGTVHLRAPAFFDIVGAHMDHSAEPASSDLRPSRTKESRPTGVPVRTRARDLRLHTHTAATAEQSHGLVRCEATAMGHVRRNTDVTPALTAPAARLCYHWCLRAARSRTGAAAFPGRTLGQR